MTDLLDVCELTVASDANRETPLVRDVSFAVPRGSALGIVGESGSGKSLTLKGTVGLLAQGLTRTVESIQFDGTEISTLSAREQRRLMGKSIGMIFQEPKAHLSPVHTIGDQLLEVIKIHHNVGRVERRAMAADLLVRSGIKQPARRLAQYPHELSGGLAQRVLIALALAGDPLLLIADEPTTALDVTVQREILDTLLELREREHLTVVLVSHDVGVIRYACDEVAVMYCGRIVEAGRTGDVLDDPSHPYTRGLMASVPRLSSTTFTASLPGQVPQPAEFQPGCDFVNRCSISDEACLAPIELRRLGMGRSARCVRPVHHSEMAAVSGGAG